MQILLIEPNYKNKYPPLGLMKISRFFKERGDDVVFFKGCSLELRDEFDWDYILITSLFTFEWKQTVDTIKFYQLAPSRPKIFCGGILASLMPEQLKRETGVNVVTGLLDRKGTYGIPGEETIEWKIPDYSMLEDIEYKYPVADSYFVYFTRGCVNKCKFCAVPKLEPQYEEYRHVVSQVEQINKEYGEKQNMLIMDNNTVASPCFDQIIADIQYLGFTKGAKLGRKQRIVDFNQGLDARRMTEESMRLLASIPVKPLRIAFDDINTREPYVASMRWAAQYGLTLLSNYVLYNYKDTPEDFFERLKINIELNSELGTSIYSFPMKYSPIFQTTRTHIGPHWNWRYLRGVKCILQATHGVVGPKQGFFEHAFGSTVSDFLSIITMPEKYIIDRVANESTSNAWRKALDELSVEERIDFSNRALEGRHPSLGSEYPAVEKLLLHY